MLDVVLCTHLCMIVVVPSSSCICNASLLQRLHDVIVGQVLSFRYSSTSWHRLHKTSSCLQSTSSWLLPHLQFNSCFTPNVMPFPQFLRINDNILIWHHCYLLLYNCLLHELEYRSRTPRSMSPPPRRGAPEPHGNGKGSRTPLGSRSRSRSPLSKSPEPRYRWMVSFPVLVVPTQLFFFKPWQWRHSRWQMQNCMGKNPETFDTTRRSAVFLHQWYYKTTDTIIPFDHHNNLWAWIVTSFI